MAGAEHSIVDYGELHSFAHQVKQYLKGNISNEDFMAMRLQQGVYGQRQDDNYMVRIKIPGGYLMREQLFCIGELVERYSSIEFANITTRQDIQLHFVKLHDVPKVLLRLADVGLTTREACGNTVRNITACPYAGSCDREILDAQTVVDNVVKHCMRHPVMQHLPRKFKISVSGCEQDCAMGMIQDIGVIAVRDNEKSGFRIRVGGGLGHKPKESFVLEEFVEDNKLLAVIESIILLHNKYSDRTKRAKSRLKFLVDRFGEQEFKRRYQETLSSNLQKHALSSEQTSHLISFRNFISSTHVELSLNKGDISSQDIKRLGTILMEYPDLKFKTLQNQNLLIRNIADQDLDNLKHALLDNSFKIQESQPKAVACPGNWTCRLGITSSRALVEKLVQGNSGMRIHVSGCHNGCAQPQVADIGLHGEAKRLFGYLVPYYRLHLGGNGIGQGNLALKGPEIPAVRVPQALEKVQVSYAEDHVHGETFHQWVKRKKLPFFTELLESFTFVTAGDLSSLLKDVDQAQAFKVLQLGGGECAGVKEETIASKRAELAYEIKYRNIFVEQHKLDSALECVEQILRLSADIILTSNKLKTSSSLEDANSKLVQYLSHEHDNAKTFQSLMTQLAQEKRQLQADSCKRFFKELDAWVGTWNILVDSSDLQARQNSLSASIDLSGEAGPMQFLKARQALRQIKAGNALEFVLSNDDGAVLVSNGLEKIGFKILSDTTLESRRLIRVLKPEDYQIRESSKENTIKLVTMEY